VRFLSLQPDPVAGGSTHDALTTDGTVAPAWPALAGLLPVTGGSVDPGLTQIDRDDDVTGLGASQAPETLSSAPEVTVEMRAFPAVAHRLIRDALKGTATASGTAPAAITTTIEAEQDGPERCSIATLVREGQVDRVSGVAFNEIELEMAIDEDATISATGWGLYHDVLTEAEAGLTAPLDQPVGHVYKLRDVYAYLGAGAGVQIDCVAGFGLTFSANLDDDAQTRFCAGRQIAETVINGQRYRVWYPDRHKRKGKRGVTCRVDFASTQVDQELARILSKADRLRVEIAGARLGTTPEADQMLGLILHRVVPTDGGPDEMNANDALRSSYEYGVYLDPDTNKDIQAEIVGTAAIS
jgi:hypothetical protein